MAEIRVLRNSVEVGAAAGIDFKEGAGIGLAVAADPLNSQINVTVSSGASFASYGAVGDGVTDDSAAIDALFAGASAGATVYVEAGTYLTDAFSVPAGVTVRGNRDAIFKMKAAANTTLVTLGAGSVLDGVTVDGNRSNQSSSGHGVSLGAAGAIIRDCKVMNCYGYGVVSTNKDGVRVEGCEIVDTRWQAIFVEVTSVAIERVRITDNYVDRSGEDETVVGTAITLKGTASYKISGSVVSGNEVKMPTTTPPAGAICIETFGNVERCRIIGNDCSGGSMGISLDKTIYSTCTGNTVYNAKTNGIELASASQCTVGENTVDGNSLTANGISVSNTAPVKNNIVGNNIRGCATRGIIATDADFSSFVGNVIEQPAGYAIEILSTQHFTVTGNTLVGLGTGTKGLTINTSDRCQVIGNDFYNFTQHGVLVYAASAVTLDRITITGNTFDTCNVPAATSLSGGAALGNLVMVALNPGHSATQSFHILDWQNTVYNIVGTGSPESAQSGGVGSLFYRRDGGAATSLYVKESGTGNTGWVAK